MTASSKGKKMPPAGPQAPRWPGHQSKSEGSPGLGQGAGHPSAIGRACLADQATAIKAGLDSRVPARYPCGAADGDGMTRQPPPWRNKRQEKITNPGPKPKSRAAGNATRCQPHGNHKALTLIPEITDA